MTTTMNSRLSWAGDILLLNTFRPLLTEEGAAKFRRSLWLAGLQGTLEGVGTFHRPTRARCRDHRRHDGALVVLVVAVGVVPAHLDACDVSDYDRLAGLVASR